MYNVLAKSKRVTCGTCKKFVKFARNDPEVVLIHCNIVNNSYQQN